MSKPSWLPGLERFAHMSMGFGARLIYIDIILWWREAKKQWPPETNKQPMLEIDMRDITGENKKYWYVSSDRTIDMLSDMRDYHIGANIAELVRWPIIIWSIMKFVK